MAVITFKIPTFYRRFLYIITTTSWLTGIIFFILSTFFIVEGEFGPEKHSWQFPILMIHGASAFLMIISYGALLISHIPSSWKLNRMRGIGISLILFVGIQVITAYMLYYLSNETFRTIITWCHLIVGFYLPFLLVTHIVVGIKSGSRYKKKKQEYFIS